MEEILPRLRTTELHHIRYALCLGTELRELEALLESPPHEQPLNSIVERMDDGNIKVKFFDLDTETIRAITEMQLCKVFLLNDCL